MKLTVMKTITRRQNCRVKKSVDTRRKRKREENIGYIYGKCANNCREREKK